MSYIQGFLLAVPDVNKDAYCAMAERAWAVFKALGCQNMHENWADDVQPGKVTSFPQAVQLKDGESVVFSWMTWPDKDTCDAAWGKIMSDEALQAQMGADMPFDGMRMMWGGFTPLFTAQA